MQCKYCGQKLKKNDQFCKECGFKNEFYEPINKRQCKFIRIVRYVIGGMIFLSGLINILFPGNFNIKFIVLMTLMGISIMPIYEHINKHLSKPLHKSVACIVPLIFFILVGIASDSVEENYNTEGNNDVKVEQNEEKIDIKKEESKTDGENNIIVKKLVSLGFTKNEAINNGKILMKCGIPNINNCEDASPNNSLDELKAFRVKLDENRTLLFTEENRKIFYVSLNDDILYDKENGGFLKNYKDVHIPEKHVSDEVWMKLKDEAEIIILGYFGDDFRYLDAWGVAREDNKYMVYCEATDGSLMTGNWIQCRVWFKKDKKGNFKPTKYRIGFDEHNYNK